MSLRLQEKPLARSRNNDNNNLSLLLWHIKTLKNSNKMGFDPKVKCQQKW